MPRKRKDRGFTWLEMSVIFTLFAAGLVLGAVTVLAISDHYRLAKLTADLAAADCVYERDGTPFCR